MISVIIPTFGRLETLNRAISSVVNQDWCGHDYEVIVVSDNHLDSEIHQKIRALGWFQRDDCQLLVNTISSGSSCARNTGIAHARGERIAFLDDDDYWLPGKIKYQLEYIASADKPPVLVGTAFYPSDGENLDTSQSLKPSKSMLSFDDLLTKRKIGRGPKLSSCLIRTDSLFEAGLFDTKLEPREDLDLFLRLSHLGTIVVLKKAFVCAEKKNGDRLSRNYSKLLSGFEQFYWKYSNELKDRPLDHLMFWRQYSRIYFRHGEYLYGLLNFLRIIVFKDGIYEFIKLRKTRN